MKTIYELECWIRAGESRRFSVEIDQGKFFVGLRSDDGAAYGRAKTLSGAIDSAMTELREEILKRVTRGIQ